MTEPLTYTVRSVLKRNRNDHAGVAKYGCHFGSVFRAGKEYLPRPAIGRIGILPRVLASKR